MTPLALSTRFFLQVAVVLVVCRVFARIGSRFGQPPVVSEMVAGIALGPSLFGSIWPGGQHYLFPALSRPVLFATAQIGLVLYMFTVGLEFQPRLLGPRLYRAAAIAASGVAAPCVLGVALAVLLYAHGGCFQPGITLGQAAPFLAAALAITAFPMLARIILERGMAGTRIGTLALAAGAIDDAASWAVLAVVVASVRRSPAVAVLAIGGGGAFAFGLLRWGRRPLGALNRLAARPGGEKAALAWTLTALALCAWFTDTIGLYAVFGAVVLGAALPRGPWCARLRDLIEPITSTFFLPLFFVYSGLNTQVSALTGGWFWFAGLLILAAAVLGKAGACYAAARACGEDHRSAWALGSLMNARGLMELIALNIGLEHGIITPALFALLAGMAVITTFMATPMFNRVADAGFVPELASAPGRA